MAERINIDEILKKNPDIRADKLNESRQLREALHKNGVRRAEYRLAAGGVRRRIEVVDPDNQRRTAHLHKNTS